MVIKHKSELMSRLNYNKSRIQLQASSPFWYHLKVFRNIIDAISSHKDTKTVISTMKLGYHVVKSTLVMQLTIGNTSKLIQTYFKLVKSNQNQIIHKDYSIILGGKQKKT